MTEEMKVGTEVGNVIWFDQKKGFGFVKILTPGSEYLDKEIFVHFSSINSENSFKKLYPGENVSLDVEKNTDENANGKNVSGLFGSQLLVDNQTYIYKVIRRRPRDENQDNGLEGGQEGDQ